MKNRLRELRKSMRITQTELADKLGYSKPAISHYERGIRDIPNELLVNLAIFFDTTVDDILCVDLVKEERKANRNYFF